MDKKSIVLAVLLLTVGFAPFKVYSLKEPGKQNLSIGADIVSRYVWRGINIGGSSPHVQPFIDYSFGSSGLSVGAWGSYSLGFGAYGTEADLYLSWSPVNAINITLSDYFFPVDSPFERNDYFNYKKNETGHTLEAMITLGSTEAFPFYATFAMNLYGVDGLNEKGENYHAKYVELGYARSFASMDASFFMGIAPDDPKTGQGGQGYYGDRAGIINLGITLSKQLSIKELGLPVFTSLIFNPEAGNFYLVAGISF